MIQAMEWKATRGTGKNTREHFLQPLLTSEVLWEAFHHLSQPSQDRPGTSVSLPPVLQAHYSSLVLALHQPSA